MDAPKNVPPTYINYYDICYSQPGPRRAQVFLEHILTWNLLLVGSANAAEIAILGTQESGETPSWIQYITNDTARAELPLSPDKEDTYPIGLSLDTGTTHSVVVDEKSLAVMPMLHILSTHGLLLSFDLLNLQANAISLCSPPQPINDKSASGHFVIKTVGKQLTVEEKTPSPIATTNVTYSIPSIAATSTPAKPSVPTTLFGDGFSAAKITTVQPSSVPFGNTGSVFGTAASFAKPADKPVENLPPKSAGAFSGFGSFKPETKSYENTASSLINNGSATTAVSNSGNNNLYFC